MHDPPQNPIQDHSEFLELETFLALMRTHEIHMTRQQQFFKSHGLSTQQYNALRIVLVRAGKEGVPSLEIGRRLINRVPDITRLLDRLERNGWITRDRSKEDRRVVRVKLTPSGRKLMEQVDEPLVELHREAFGHMSQEDLRDLVRLLQRASQIPGYTAI